jgi:hypothetical protein
MLGQKKVQNQTRFSADQTLDLYKSIMHMHHHDTHARTWHTRDRPVCDVQRAALSHTPHETDPSAMCSGRCSLHRDKTRMG